MQKLCKTQAAMIVAGRCSVQCSSRYFKRLQRPFNIPKALSIGTLVVAWVTLYLVCFLFKWPLSLNDTRICLPWGYAESPSKWESSGKKELSKQRSVMPDFWKTRASWTDWSWGTHKIVSKNPLMITNTLQHHRSKTFSVYICSSVVCRYVTAINSTDSAWKLFLFLEKNYTVHTFLHYMQRYTVPWIHHLHPLAAASLFGHFIKFAALRRLK